MDVREALAAHGSIRKAAAALGIPASTFQNRLSTALVRAARTGEISSPPVPHPPPEGFEIFRNSAAYNADGALLRQWVGTKPGAGGEYVVPAGHVVKGESTLVNPEGRVLAKWIKTKEDQVGASLVGELQKAFVAYDGKAPEIATPGCADHHGLTLYPLPDLHFGMYSWGPETGADYDVTIAEAMAVDAIDRLVARSNPTRHATLLGLGDYFHGNDHSNATPAHKHTLDVDTRFSRVLALGAGLAVKIVDRLARYHDEVEVVFLPGNHDPEAALALAVALALFYSKTPRIKVRLDPSLVWCRRFGAQLLAATHGHTMKTSRFRSYLTGRHARDWGLATYRSGFMGHVHHETANEDGGIRIESFQSPAAPDAYAANGGYIAGRSLTAITFDDHRGETGRHRVNIEAPAAFRDPVVAFEATP